LDIHLCKNVNVYYTYHNKMATQHCFTPVTIAPAAGVPGYTIMTVPADVAVAGTVVPYLAGQTYVEYVPVVEGAPATPIRFFKFEVGNTAPKYIAKHDDDYAVAIDDVVIGPTNTYLVMRKANDFVGGSKSSRKGRKSARKGRKSARKSRRARGSRSKK